MIRITYWLSAGAKEVVAIVYIDGVDTGRLQVPAERWNEFSASFSALPQVTFTRAYA